MKIADFIRLAKKAKQKGKPRAQPEAIIQRALAAYLDARHLHWFHTPNERPNFNQRVELSHQGVKSGVSDIIIVNPIYGPFRHVLNYGLWIEVKVSHSASTLEPSQEQWIRRAMECGRRAEVCWGARDALLLIDECYGINKAALEMAVMMLGHKKYRRYKTGGAEGALLLDYLAELDE